MAGARKNKKRAGDGTGQGEKIFPYLKTGLRQGNIHPPHPPHTKKNYIYIFKFIDVYIIHIYTQYNNLVIIQFFIFNNIINNIIVYL